MDSRLHSRSRIRLVDRLLGKAGRPAGGEALEVGCGSGFASAHLAGKYGMRVVGTDAEEDRIKTALRKNIGSDRLSFMVADATALPFEDNRFDLVLAQNVFHHISDWKAAAGEIARVLGPGGLFLISDIRSPGATTRIIGRIGKSHGFRETDEMIELLRALGLEITQREDPAGALHKEFAFLFRKHDR
jgi:ubiquinone/menaquinone biosynthesis C-methylase UbiE